MNINDVIKKQGPIFITSLIGTIIIADKFFAVTPLHDASVVVKSWASQVFNFTTFAALFGLVKHHIGLIKKEQSLRQYIKSGSLFAAFIVTLAIGLMFGAQSNQYSTFFEAVYGSQSKALYALTFFSIASAIYRSLRIKSLESGILFASLMVYLLQVSPYFNAIIPGLKPFNDFLMMYFSKAGENGALICVGAASLVFGIRLLTNTESLMKR